jgi:hypothetical protein
VRNSLPSKAAPDAVQIESNRLGGVDLAARFANQSNAAIARIDANGQTRSRFELPILGELHMNSPDQLFVRTPENNLVRVANNGTVLWERALFSGAPFRFFAVSDGLAVASEAALYTLDVRGNVIASLNAPALAATRMDCHRTDVLLSGNPGPR